MERQRHYLDIALAILLITTNAYASPPTRQNTYTTGSTISATNVTANEDAIYNYLQGGVDTIADNSIVNADVSSAANIQSDKVNLTSVAQNISNTGTLTNTGNVTITGTVTVSGVTYATLPAGVMMAWGTNTAPNGWLLCDGSAVSRTTYSGLFSVIGTTYGSGDGSTTFNVPNIKGKNIVGRDSSDTSFDVLAETGGEKTHTLTIPEMPSHNHSVTILSGGSGLGNGGNSNTSTSTTGSTGGGGAHNVLDPYIVLNYIIKI